MVVRSIQFDVCFGKDKEKSVLLIVSLFGGSGGKSATKRRDREVWNLSLSPECRKVVCACVCVRGRKRESGIDENIC